MAEPFIYDTHYQVDKPFAFLDLTLATASPTEHASDDVLARRLEARAKTLKVVIDDETTTWRPNRDQMRYWIGNCHASGLLSRQNSYDYWLMNFKWLPAFPEAHECWGQLQEENSSLARLLLLRWAWVFDAPMLIALAWRMNKLGTCDMGDLVVKAEHHVEDILSDVFAAVRDATVDPRERTAYRHKLEELRRGFQYNTRRHKICTHLGILSDAGLLKGAKMKALHQSLAGLLDRFDSGREAAAESLRSGPLGQGTSLFLVLIEKTSDLRPQAIGELTEADWPAVLREIRKYWRQVEEWDRKFLGIRALAEFFMVKNLVTGKPLWPVESWQRFLTHRARYAPEELTVHVDRFGRVEYLRLSTVS